MRIAEQVPYKFALLTPSAFEEKWRQFKNTVNKYKNLSNWKYFGKSLKDQINVHGDEIHKAMHLADLGEDDFYRNGLEATSSYFIQDGIKSQARRELIRTIEENLPNLDARERAVEPQVGVGVSESL